LDERIGSLTAGKAADLVAIDLGRIASQPVYDPISQIVYTAGRDQVTDVWVAGKRLLQDGRLTTLDEETILGKAQAWRDKISVK
jgi:5-methylthioadenosine/S-adenosylhomocysteine deaminase